MNRPTRHCVSVNREVAGCSNPIMAICQLAPVPVCFYREANKEILEFANQSRLLGTNWQRCFVDKVCYT